MYHIAILTATKLFDPVKVYSVALYPKAKAPTTVTAKLMADQIWEFIALTEKKQIHVSILNGYEHLVSVFSKFIITSHYIGT